MKRLLASTMLGLLAGSILAAPPTKNTTQDNLKALARALKIYQATHQGKNPPNIAELYYQGYIDDLSKFVNPGAKSLPTRAELAVKSDYTLESLAGIDGLIVREKHSTQKDDKLLAAFADGSVKLVGPGGTSTPATNTEHNAKHIATTEHNVKPVASTEHNAKTVMAGEHEAKSTVSHENETKAAAMNDQEPIEVRGQSAIVLSWWMIPAAFFAGAATVWVTLILVRPRPNAAKSRAE